MKTEKMFELATRRKMRFAFKGQISTEDLWDLSVESLDMIYKGLNSQLKQVQEESLLNVKSSQDEEIILKTEIIKHIFTVKTEEALQRTKVRERKLQKEKILEIMASKQDESLQGKSIDELKAMLEEIGE